eukprot:scaffold84269_cov64-Phaeocystis_antarctica.AAC.5
MDHPRAMIENRSLTPSSQSLFVRVCQWAATKMEARQLLKEQFATFDAGKAQCFLASDREHLLAVIEAGFGDFYDFNRVARNLLVSRLRNRSFPPQHAPSLQ